MSGLNGTDGVNLTGASMGDFSSDDSRAAGDVNGDCIDDLIIGSNASPGRQMLAGTSHVLFGRDTAFPAQLSLMSLDGSNGFAINGSSTNDFANAVGGAGDINGDGIDDVVIGSSGAVAGAGISAGHVLFDCIDAPNADQRDTNGDGIGNICDADSNDDCVVNVVDLGLLRSVFFTEDSDADFNGDEIVNVIDLGILKTFLFEAPGPSGLPNDCDGM